MNVLIVTCWSAHAPNHHHKPHTGIHTYSYTQTQTHPLWISDFVTFSENRQTGPDLPDTSVTRVPIVMVGLGDLWGIMIGRQMPKVTRP